jgi:O-antigen/teichoic acid export membrane protein
VGVYGIAFRVSLVVSLLVTGVQSAAMPHVLSRHSEPETPAEVARALRLFWALGCVAFIGLSIFAEPLVRLLAARAYFGGAHLVPFLVAATFLGGAYVFAPGPVIAGRTRAFAALNVVAGLMNLGLAFALVGAYGVVGAGIATVVSSGFAFASTMVLSQRLFLVPHEWWRLAASAVVATGTVLAARSAIVLGRDSALAASPVLERVALGAAGCLLVAAMLLERGEIRSLRFHPAPEP